MRIRNRAPGHPGLILRRLYLDSLNVSNAQLAECIGVSRKTVSKIVNGKGAITPEMALRLSRAFNTSPELWLNMQVAYDLWQASHKSKDWQNVEAIDVCESSSTETIL
jgi:addiction module HigA family antidote